jgi:hypothetical protein
MTKTISIKLAEREFELLDKIATELGITRTDPTMTLLIKFNEAIRTEREKACRECAVLSALLCP